MCEQVRARSLSDLSQTGQEAVVTKSPNSGVSVDRRLDNSSENEEQKQGTKVTRRQHETIQGGQAIALKNGGNTDIEIAGCQQASGTTWRWTKGPGPCDGGISSSRSSRKKEDIGRAGT